MNDKIAVKILFKYLRKGNMSRCLRDILPKSKLNLTEREEVADLIHDIVRWKRLYDLIIEERGYEKTPEIYIKLNREQYNIDTDTITNRFELKYSYSNYIAKILEDKKEWAEYLNTKPEGILCINFNKSSISDVTKILKKENLPANRSVLESTIITSPIARYSSVIKNHYAHIQDESSQLIAYITNGYGYSILDLCAGNGGKSLAIASISRNKKKLSAYEIDNRRRINLKRRCLEYSAKVDIYDKKPDQKYDVVLVDAPCTGVGAARRNPEAKYIDSAGNYPALQYNLLKEAIKLVNKEGIVLYTVCTFTPEETVELIKKFSDDNDVEISKPSDRFSRYLTPAEVGSFTRMPHGDIFYIAAIKPK
ncbi:MAG: RsmB/NOP family class I SAM-dependent RNA methyltransferase [Candidatus Thermoplasmatota archaeon]